MSVEPGFRASTDLQILCTGVLRRRIAVIRT